MQRTLPSAMPRHELGTTASSNYRYEGRDIWRVKARYQRLGYFVRSWVCLLNTLRADANVAGLWFSLINFDVHVRCISGKRPASVTEGYIRSKWVAERFDACLRYMRR